MSSLSMAHIGAHIQRDTNGVTQTARTFDTISHSARHLASRAIPISSHASDAEVLTGFRPKVDSAWLAPPSMVTVDGMVVHLVATEILLLWQKHICWRLRMLKRWLLPCKRFRYRLFCLERPTLLIFVLRYRKRTVAVPTTHPSHPAERLNDLHHWEITACEVGAEPSILLNVACHAMPHCHA